MTIEELKELADKGLITNVTLFQAIENGDINIDDIDEKYLTEYGYVTVVGAFEASDDNNGDGDDEANTTPDPGEPGEEIPEEPKSDEEYATEVTNALKAGGDVKLEQKLVLETGILTLTSATPTTLDLNDQELEVKEGGQYGDTCQVGNGADVTIKNGELKPAGNASQANQSATVILKTAAGGKLTLDNVKVSGYYPVYLNSTNESASIEILSGEFYSLDDGNATIYVGKGGSTSTTGGKIVIKGGTFGLPGHTSAYLLNVEDVLRKQEGKEPRNFIEVFGGEFYNFNPADNAAEGAGTNFVADGYKVGVKGEVYKVIAANEEFTDGFVEWTKAETVAATEPVAIKKTSKKKTTDEVEPIA